MAHARLRVLNIFDEAGCSDLSAIVQVRPPPLRMFTLDLTSQGQEFLQYLEEHFEPRIYLQGQNLRGLVLNRRFRVGLGSGGPGYSTSA